MAATESRMLELGTVLPTFSLLDTTTAEVFTCDALRGAPAAVVAFICNHCPFVKHIRAGLADFGRYCQQRGVKMVAVCSNDVTTHPDDAPQRMAEEARRVGYVFPYLYDQTQAVAKAFQAACTPEFYVFDSEGKLAYRGQFDDSRPSNNRPVTGSDVRAAVDALLAGNRPSPQQKPSIGCNIKWQAGNAPEYA